MIPGENARKTTRHEEPDRILVSLGKCASTTMTGGAYETLEKYLGIKDETNSLSNFS
jgi:hypothetical protein